MDALLLALQDVSVQLLPILGVIALIFLCILLNKLSKLVEKIIFSISNLENTIKLVDMSIEKAQAPLNTVVKLSGTIDNVHNTSVESFNKAKKFINENINDVKNHVSQKKEKIENNLKEEIIND